MLFRGYSKESPHFIFQGKTMKKILGTIAIVWILGLGKTGWCKDDNAKFLHVRIPFIENQGQVQEGISFYAQTFFGKIVITKEGEILYHLSYIKQKKNLRNPNLTNG